MSPAARVEDQHLGNADRQSAHGRRDDGGAAGAGEANHAADVAAAKDVAPERLGHGGDRDAAIGGVENRRRPVRMASGEHVGGHVHVPLVAARTDIEGHDPQAGLADQARNVVQFIVFRIEGAYDIGRARALRPWSPHDRFEAASAAAPSKANRNVSVTVRITSASSC
jgi:hypothetical protein